MGGVGLWTPQGAARYRRVSPVLGAAGAGAATTCVPASWPGVGGGSGVRALTAAAAWGSRGCRRWDPTFLRAPGSSPTTTPESAVPQSCRGRRREGVRGGRGAYRALPQRGGAAASARPPPGLPRHLPVVGAAGRAGWRLRRTRAPGSGHHRGKFGFGQLPERCRGGRARRGWQCPSSAHFGGHEGGLRGSEHCASGPTLPPLAFIFAATPGEGAVLSSRPERALSSREDASRPRSRHRWVEKLEVNEPRSALLARLRSCQPPAPTPSRRTRVNSWERIPVQSSPGCSSMGHEASGEGGLLRAIPCPSCPVPNARSVLEPVQRWGRGRCPGFLPFGGGRGQVGRAGTMELPPRRGVN